MTRPSLAVIDTAAAARDAGTAIEFRGVSKRFGVAGGAQALDQVDLTIGRGEVFCLMGTSGGGKSTLLRHINGLVEPTGGAVLVHGRAVAGLSPAALRTLRGRQVGMVFQHFGLLPHRTALENVLLPLELQGVAPEEARARAAGQLAQMGLGDALDRLPAELSGGMQQRVGLARALVGQPDILLMDEPFGALDPTIRRDLQQQVLDLVRARGITAVLVTHDPAEALRLADRIALLRDGRIIQVGTPAELLRQPADAWAADFFRGFAPDSPAAPQRPSALPRPQPAPAPLPPAPEAARSPWVDALLGPARFAGTRWALFWTGLLAEAAAAALAGTLAASSSLLPLAFAALLVLATRGVAVLAKDTGRADGRTVASALAVLWAILALVAWRAAGHPLAYGLAGPLADKSVTVATGTWLDQAIAWSQATFQPVFVWVTFVIRMAIEAVEAALAWLPWPVPAIALLYAALQFAGVPVFLLALASIGYLVGFGFWPQTIATLSLVGASVALTIGLGVPAGILLARSRWAFRIASPILDIMQTLPSFVYLIPAVAFFSVGKTPAVVATIVFALPPMVRLTTLGILEVPKPAVEAAYAHGATPWQVLRKVELPLAIRALLLGINQTIVMSLSMVVVSALIGAGGLGYDVVTALRNIQGGAGFLAGIAIVACALVPDRIIQGALQRDRRFARP